MKGGPVCSDVVARVAADAVNGVILSIQRRLHITRSLDHTSLEGELRDIQTILVFEASKAIAITDSPRLCSARVSVWIWKVQ